MTAETHPQFYNSDGKTFKREILQQLEQDFYITEREANQWVTWGDYEGPAGEMFLHQECPVGAQMRRAIEKGREKGKSGAEVMQEQFALYEQMDDRFHIEVAPETVEQGIRRDAGEKKGGHNFLGR